MTTLDDIRERLSEIRPPGQARDIVTLGLITQLNFDSGRVTLHLQPAELSRQGLEVTIADIRRAVGALDGVSSVDVHVPGAHGAASPYGELGPLPGVADIVAVSSTKGGVGKSTV